MNKQWTINGGRGDISKAYDILSIQMWVSFYASWYLLNERRMCARIHEKEREREKNEREEETWDDKLRDIDIRIKLSFYSSPTSIYEKNIDNQRQRTSFIYKRHELFFSFFISSAISLLTFEIDFYCLNTHSDSCLMLDILVLLLS